MLLPAARRDSAAALAHAVRAAISRLHIPSPAGEGRVSVSIGVGHVDIVDGDDSERLVSAADSALYAAKRAGRDMIMFEEPVIAGAGLC